MKQWLWGCAALATRAFTQTADSQASSITAATMTITALQWNPHWECFRESAECKSQVMELLSSRLRSGTDFANVVELETEDFVAPSGWKNISSFCGRDVTYLFFDAVRWNVLELENSGERGCMVENNRPYVVQAFKHQSEDLAIIVIGAHFPHARIGTTLPKSIQAVSSTTGIDSIMLIADTNINRPHPSWWPGTCPPAYCRTSAEIFEALGLQANATISTDLVTSCCANPPYYFLFEFDRVIANFGTGITTQLHDDPTPSWVVGAFHKAVTGRLTVPLRRNLTKRALRQNLEYIM